jgi:hypothetical protein
MSEQHLLAKRLSLALAAIALTVGLICLTDRILGLNLEGKLSQLRLKLFPGHEPPMFELDERLGWRHKPGARRTHQVPEYNVTYTIGPDGNRIVPGCPDSGTMVTFLGCSFCFGLGVNDDEVFSSVLQRDYWKTCRVRNLGCIGYTTSHVLLCLENEIRAGRKIDVAIYCWMWHHRFRNDRRRGWLSSLTHIESAKNPLYEVEGGRLVFKGLIGVDQSLPDGDPALPRREAEVTRALLEAIRAMCQTHGIRLVVVMYPPLFESHLAQFEALDREMVSECQSLGIEYLDLTGCAALRDPANYYLNDKHPRPSWHRIVARLIAEGVDPKTGRVRSHATSTQGSR